jgi:hypothetical protein
MRAIIFLLFITSLYISHNNIVTAFTHSSLLLKPFSQIYYDRDAFRLQMQNSDKEFRDGVERLLKGVIIGALVGGKRCICFLHYFVLGLCIH